MELTMPTQRFKLRMRPKSMPMKFHTAHLPPLPPSKSLTEVFGDYLAYLVSCVKSFIQEAQPTLHHATLFGSATYIIAHPNGWEGAQQSKLRKAAIYGKLVPDTHEGRSRVVFVSEGEASLHYCLKGGYVDSVCICCTTFSLLYSADVGLQTNKGFIVADLGGGTLDFSAYKVMKVKPLLVDEVAAAKCSSSPSSTELFRLTASLGDLDGSAFVTLRAKGFISSKYISHLFRSL